MFPFGSAGVLHLTSTVIGLTNLTETLRGREGAIYTRVKIIPMNYDNYCNNRHVSFYIPGSSVVIKVSVE